MTARPVTEWDGTHVEVLKARWGVPLLEAYSTIDSTNERLRALARSGTDPYTVVVADEQSVGRGRRGDRWHSAPGQGLLVSVLLPDVASPGPLPLVVGLVVAEVVERLCPAIRIGVKWPNDLWVGTRKVAGILCEGGGAGVVTGIGLNVRGGSESFPEELGGRVTTLEADGANTLRRSELAGDILRDLERAVAAFDGTLEGALFDRLSSRDALVGRDVVTETEGPGVADGIAADGALRLRRPDASVVRVVAGSVALR